MITYIIAAYPKADYNYLVNRYQLKLIAWLLLQGGTEVTENSESEEAKKKKKKRKARGKGSMKQQTDPPTVAVSELFPDGNFPIGQIMDYPSTIRVDDRTAKDRFTSEEARALDRMHHDIYNEARQAAEAHRQTRKHIKNWVCHISVAKSYICSKISIYITYIIILSIICFISYILLFSIYPSSFCLSFMNLQF